MVDFTGLPLPTPDVEERLEKLDRRAVSAISAADFPGYEDFLLDPANDPKPHLRQQLQRRNDCEGQALATGVEASAQKLGLPAVQYSDIFAYQASEYRDRGGRVGADQGASISAGVEVLTQGLPGICGPGLPTEADWAYQTYTRSQREFEQRARSVELESGLITEHYKAPPFREALVVMAAGGRIHWGTYWGLNWTRSRVVRRPVIKGRGGHATAIVWATKRFGAWALEVWNSHGDPEPFYVHEEEYEFLRDRRNSPFGAFALLPDRPSERFATRKNWRDSHSLTSQKKTSNPWS